MDIYATHLPVLKKIFEEHKIKRVLEFGSGKYSTPFFNQQNLDCFITVEDNPYWSSTILKNNNHEIMFMSCIEAAKNTDLNFDLIFIDNGKNSAERIDVIKTISSRRPKGLVVLHDAEQKMYMDVAKFDHIKIYPEETPSTAVCWNNNIKYSILLPYYNRPELRSTFLSFIHHYSNRNDFEIIIIEDSKNVIDVCFHDKLITIIDEFKNKLNIKHIIDRKESYNPSSKFNLGFKNSMGKFIVVSNPEIFHAVNILKSFDMFFEIHSNDYIVCSCKSMIFGKQIQSYEDMAKGEFKEWYQHPKYRNALFHFCSALSRENYIKIGGFDERYCNGVGFDDNSFLERIKRNNIEIFTDDSLITYHLEHDKTYLDNIKNLIEKNRQLFNTQMKTGDFFEPNEIRNLC
jgi:hypothetical protein